MHQVEGDAGRLRSRRRPSRRTALAGTGAAGIAAFLAACRGNTGPTTSGVAGSGGAGGSAAATSAAAPTTKPFDKLTIEEMRTLFGGARLKDLPGQKSGPVAGGVGRFSFGRTPVTWDPLSPAGTVLASYQYAWNQLVGFSSHDFLKNPNFMEYEPVLAAAMPEQPDDTTYVFKLNRGVKFHNVPPVNGREFTADDVVYCIDAYRKAPGQGPTFEDVERVERVDSHTVTLKMARPAAYFLTTLAVPIHYMFAREQHQSPDGLAKQPIGTGAWIFESAEPNAGYKFKKNPEYWRKDPRSGKQLPYMERIEFSFFPSTAQLVAAYRAKELDQVSQTLPFQDLAGVVKTDPDSVVQCTIPNIAFQPYIAMRLDKPPLNDVRVRRALSLLIDRDTLLKSVGAGMAGYGYGQDWTYFGQEWPWEPNQLGPWHTYDPKEAKQLLDAAGIKELQLDFLMSGFPGFYFELPSAIAGLWQQQGVKTTIDATTDQAKYNQQYFGRTYNHLVASGNTGPGLDPDTYSYQALHSKSPKNYFFVNNARIDELAVKQRQTMNKEERKKLLKEIMDIDLDMVSRLWSISPYRFTMRRPYLYNIVDTANGWNPGWGGASMDAVWRSQ
ncbi:MAG: ABC transporter substrate-binding protein [Dehalococcoidia bacterium]